MKLNHTITAGKQSLTAVDLDIYVDYEPNEGVTEVISVYAHGLKENRHDGNCLDMMAMLEKLNVLDQIIDEIDWDEVAAEHKAYERDRRYESYAE